MTTNAPAWSLEFRRKFQRLTCEEGVFSGAIDACLDPMPNAPSKLRQSNSAMAKWQLSPRLLPQPQPCREAPTPIRFESALRLS